MCHWACQPTRYETEPRTEAEPRTTAAVPEPHDVRASDAERERVVEALRSHAGAGRLEASELEERIGLALSARTRADLAALLEDLPAERAPRREAATTRTGTHHGPPPLVPIALLLIAIWALTGAGYFWPIWPLLWIGLASLGHRHGHTRVTGNTHLTR